MPRLRHPSLRGVRAVIPSILKRRRGLFGALLLAAATGGCSASGPGRDGPEAIILIVVDTLRADRLAAWGGERPVTPRLDAWMERAVLFEQARAPSPWTLPSFASLYTGWYPARHGARTLNPLENERQFAGLGDSAPMLAEVLAEAGWTTGAFATNRFLAPQFGLARGFQTYVQTWKHEERLTPTRADRAVDGALAWLDEHESGPFFLALHVFDPHLPYDPPERTRGRFTSDYGGPLRHPIRYLRRVRSTLLNDADRGFIENAYEEDLAFSDEHLGRFLDEIERRGLLGRALVVLTSDHGEEFWEHDGFEHGHTLYDELLHVPLAAWGPGLTPRRIDTAVSLTDLMPTLLEAAGAPVPEGLDGRSVWPALRDGEPVEPRPVFAEHPLYVRPGWAVVDDGWKLVAWEEDRVELFDLNDDPGETRNLAEDHPEIAERLRDLVAPRRERTATDAVPVELDEATLEALRTLGYVE